MLAEVIAEFRKLLRKPRTFIGPAAMGILVILIMVSLKFGGVAEQMHERLSSDFIITGSFVNAAFIARYMLFEFVVFMFLPLFACLVFGDLIASESADGTLRTLLCRPVTRIGVAVSKYIVGTAYVFALTLGTGLFAYTLGTIFLGRGDLISMNGGIWILPEDVAVLRLLAVYALVAVGMISIGSIAFAISTFISNANGAIAGAMGVVVFSLILGQIDYFAALRPFLLTTYLRAGDFFQGDFNIALFQKSICVLVIYSLIGLITGLFVFHRRDILS